ncbi:hypothetical protein FRB96_003060 [Tulasnella sp. 330]|nr:hypothetical protein FRB96_003060 [Tulasnella sp. 330]KAG8874616.1 hypothetical protein FRB97_005783 [Tulasnella sp. 331]KAG8879395.1 hypothetical protein FRB98_005676 [Tulasnella sp. 332]
MASAGVVNIRRDVEDKFYRYKMPVLQTKIEGKGNGIKTVLPNVTDVARSLSRPPSYPTKYFGGELGANSTIDEKNDRFIVNGAHDANRLRDLLDGFIDKFVLCGECKNPETDLFLTKTGDIFRDCKACGARTQIDPRQKLCTYIGRNPPKKEKAKAKKKAEGGENGDKENGDKEGEENGHDEEGSDDEFTKRIKAEAAELPTSEQAAATGMAGLSLDGDDGSDEGDSPLSQLTLWLEECKGDENKHLTEESVTNKLHDLGLESKYKACQTLAEYLFTERILTELPGILPVFQKIVTSEKHQKALLGGLERLVGVHYPSLIPSVPKILMAYYQADVLEEEVITQWGTHVSKKYVDKDTSKKVRKASEAMLKWLEEADDDSEEE